MVIPGKYILEQESKKPFKIGKRIQEEEAMKRFNEGKTIGTENYGDKLYGGSFGVLPINKIDMPIEYYTQSRWGEKQVFIYYDIT